MQVLIFPCIRAGAAKTGLPGQHEESTQRRCEGEMRGVLLGSYRQLEQESVTANQSAFVEGDSWPPHLQMMQ